MMSRRIPAALLAATAGATGLGLASAGPAAAQESFATLLEAYEAVAAGAPPGALAVGEVNALGDEGLELIDVTVTPPDFGTVTIESLRIDQVDLGAINEERPPLYLTATVEGLVLPVEALPQPELAEMGIEELVANIDVDFALDAESGVFDLSTAVVELVDLGTLSIELSLANVAPQVVDDPMILIGAAIASARISYDDAGLMGRSLAAAAAEEGRSEEELIEEALARIEGFRTMAGEERGPATDAALDSLAALVADAQAPEGPLVVTIEPEMPVPLAALISEEAISQGADMLNATVTYNP